MAFMDAITLKTNFYSDGGSSSLPPPRLFIPGHPLPRNRNWAKYLMGVLASAIPDKTFAPDLSTPSPEWPFGCRGSAQKYLAPS